MAGKMTTRKKILAAALTLFSEKGYDATGVDELAELAGVKGPAIYYHFKGKEAILDGIIGMLENYYEANFGSSQSITEYPSSMQELMDMTLSKINFTVHDPQIKKVRKLIIVEQFRNERMRELATMHFITGIESLYTAIFEKMMSDGLLAEDNPEILAAEFTAPITGIVHLIDREPAMEQLAMEKIRRHIEHFVRIYGS